ncbi:hypothetical protein Spico_0207 [Parasphaerochaeta coccoides DSM 17374]|uniref:Uncharacterized protein n=1 Tax=Parasphaerochaeta coccoides (strain ATCC BAA-1237 / DSM 17374 / SPN1) TaxID=760011 RepID=F4GKN3_PARC1|nr:hypothetical protein Spico_0207 [Parasphaerochaeta coccoides DSM 17374]
MVAEMVAEMIAETALPVVVLPMSGKRTIRKRGIL